MKYKEHPFRGRSIKFYCPNICCKYVRPVFASVAFATKCVCPFCRVELLETKPKLIKKHREDFSVRKNLGKSNSFGKVNKKIIDYA